MTLPEHVPLVKPLLARNDAEARHNRAHFDAHGVLAVNLMSAPGSGKTLLLEATIRALGAELPCAVIEGDLETDNDAARIRRHGVPAIQITTGSACHLDAHMVHHALHELELDGLALLFVENVGNLVCPASFALGTHRDVVLVSVTEGDDKPAKYPVMFRHADLVLVSKADLLGVIDDFEVEKVVQGVRALGNPAPVLAISARSGRGMPAWLEWLRGQRVALADVAGERRATLARI
ncbi:MAG TPA: hydrogenase nickel incorporation protein HypB [Steroidobacteraceae bacterium]|nr:hydrogenase nickel incorporation protein HypB [Steroidobacteraceae bacterium]